MLPRTSFGLLAWAVTTLALGACGVATTSTTACSPVPSAAPSPPQASAGQVTVLADRGLVARGDRVQLTVAAAGPANFSAPCTGPVSLVVSDPTGMHVFSASPAARPGDACGAVTLGAGQSARYHLVWNVDPTLPSGRYSVAATLGNLPELSVLVEVGGGVGGAPQC